LIEREGGGGRGDQSVCEGRWRRRISGGMQHDKEEKEKHAARDRVRRRDRDNARSFPWLLRSL